MTTYFTSDWHLGHKRILELCNRPFRDVDHMNSQLIERCNDIVREKDTLIMHGDNVMGTYAQTVELLRQIRCRRVIMLPGNHDRYSLAYSSTSVRKKAAVIDDLRAMGLFPQEDRRPSQWHMRVCGRKIAMSHYPYAGDSHGEDRHQNLRPEDEGLPLVHGHVHEQWRENGRMLNVGVDVWNYAPVSSDAVNTWLLGLDALPTGATA